MFATVILGNHVAKKQDKVMGRNLTDEDIKAIVALAKDERIEERVSSCWSLQVGKCKTRQV